MEMEVKPKPLGPPDAARRELLDALFEDLRTVRAHADMRTRGHSLIMQMLVGVGGIGAAIVAAVGESEVEKFADLFLVVPFLAMAAGSFYLDSSWSAYVAESYVQTRLRPQLHRLLPEASDRAESLWEFEAVAENSRSSGAAQIIGILKLLTAVLFPVVAPLFVFLLLKPPFDWTWYEGLGLALNAFLLGLLVIAAKKVHSRSGLSLAV